MSNAPGNRTMLTLATMVGLSSANVLDGFKNKIAALKAMPSFKRRKYSRTRNTNCTSKYVPHQNKRECARRVRQIKAGTLQGNYSTANQYKEAA